MQKAERKADIVTLEEICGVSLFESELDFGSLDSYRRAPSG